jgi:putative transposase
VCRRFGVSRKTGYKWRKRFKRQGLEGLKDQSRRPRRLSKVTAPELVCEIVATRMKHPSWGPKKLYAVLRKSYPKRALPSRATIARVIDRVGLVEAGRCARRRKPTAARKCVTPRAPNDLWTVDYKGWWRTRDGKRCEPLTVRDECSRMVLALRVTPGTHYEAARAEFEKLFRHYGLPRAIRSDNGPPFASMTSLGRLTRLSAWWKTLGIELDRIDPGRPEQNGSHERLHRDMSAELQRLRAANFADQQRAFDAWRKEFNTKRPHEALGMRTPSEKYKPSLERYAGERKDPEYPAHFDRRSVHRSGEIRLRGGSYFISQSLYGWEVGLEWLCDERVRLWFADMYLGTTRFIAGEKLVFEYERELDRRIE